MAGRWRRMAMVPAVGAALLAGGAGRAWASSPAAVPAAPSQVVVATIPAGPIVISVPTDSSALLDLAAVGDRRLIEGDKSQVIAGIRIVDARAIGSLPWVMSVQVSPGSVTITVG